MVKRKKRRYRRKKLVKFKLKKDTVYTIAAVSFFGIAGLVLVSLIRPDGPILGRMGTEITEWFGSLAFLLPFILSSLGLLFLRMKVAIARPNVTLGLFLSFLSLLALGKSGNIGSMLWENVSFLVSDIGAWILLFGTLVIALIILFNTSLDEVIVFMLQFTTTAYETIKNILYNSKQLPKPSIFKKKEISVKGQDMASAASTMQQQKTAVSHTKKGELIGLDATTVTNKPGKKFTWEYPPLSLLSDGVSKKADAGDIKKNADIIEQTLESFGIKAGVSEVNLGPAVTQYALEIALGTKVSKITSLSNDLALALAAPTGQIRIEAPIPGKRLVGVEVPNRSLRVVTMKEMLISEEMRRAEPKLSVSLGLNVSGKPIIADLTAMPHVLVAGTTGSGKSVMMNSVISSLLFRTTPAEVRMILIDPKRVEMTGYNGIPHLLTPVIVEISQTLSALKWAQAEMDRRYKMFAKEGARNIISYNEALGYQAIPYIIILIDELADLMAFAAAEVEDSITRLAQMARATGIHLVISTQRPSVNVITGLIKANIPSRISFNVSSMVDSRVILDMPGAEKLLGRGDMLFIPPTQSKPIRIQGTFISDKEVKELVNFLKERAKAQGIPIEYTEEVTTQKVTLTRPTGLKETVEGKDPFFEDAKRVVVQHDRASASLLQRKLKIGYARAARILDQLEASGIVSPPEGSKPREVFTQGGAI